MAVSTGNWPVHLKAVHAFRRDYLYLDRVRLFLDRVGLCLDRVGLCLDRARLYLDWVGLSKHRYALVLIIFGLGQAINVQI